MFLALFEQESDVYLQILCVLYVEEFNMFLCVYFKELLPAPINQWIVCSA